MDLFEGFHFTQTLGGETQQFRSGFYTPSRLIDRGVNIVRVRVRHRLDADRVVGTQKNVSNLHRTGLSSVICQFYFHKCGQKCPKMLFFVKKVQKNLVMSKKCSTFAPAFKN
jgi:hypothetical protein